MPKIFGDLQGPMSKNREQKELLADKKWNEVEIEGRFVGNAELGKQTFRQIVRKFSNHDDFNFFAEQTKQTQLQELGDLEAMEGVESSTTQQFSEVDSKLDQKVDESNKDDNNNTGGIIAIVSVIGAFVIAGMVVARKKLNKKVKK